MWGPAWDGPPEACWYVGEAVVAWGFVLPETVDGLPDFVDGEGAFFQLPPLGVVEDPR